MECRWIDDLLIWLCLTVWLCFRVDVGILRWYSQTTSYNLSISDWITDLRIVCRVAGAEVYFYWWMSSPIEDATHTYLWSPPFVYNWIMGLVSTLVKHTCRYWKHNWTHLHRNNQTTKMYKVTWHRAGMGGWPLFRKYITYFCNNLTPDYCYCGSQQT